MIDCYKCEWSQLIYVGRFSLCCNRFRDITELNHQVEDCSEYKERPGIDW